MVEALRENGILKDRATMSKRLCRWPKAKIKNAYSKQIALCIETQWQLFYLRCNPVKGDYNFYLYAYDKSALMEVQRQAKQLPVFCFTRLKSTGEPIRISYGANCYAPVEFENPYRLNERCRDEINGAIAQRFNGMNLAAGAVEQVVQEYGLERTRFVVAAAIQDRDGDARISHANKMWADSVRTIKDMDGHGADRASYFASMQAHSCLLDDFAIDVRKFERTQNHTKKEPERKSVCPCRRFFNVKIHVETKELK